MIISPRVWPFFLQHSFNIHKHVKKEEARRRRREGVHNILLSFEYERERERNIFGRVKTTK